MKKKNKIIHIISGLGNGGAEKTLYNIINNTKLIFDHEVVSLTNTNLYYEEKFKNINIPLKIYDFKKTKLNLLKIINLYKYIKENRENLIIQTWMYHADLLGGLLSRFAGVKKIYWNVRGDGIKFGKTKLTTCIIFLLNIFFSYIIPKKIISCSSNSIRKHILCGYSKKFMHINNGIDLNYFYPNNQIGLKFRKKHNIDKDTFLIGILARYSPQKNFDILIKSLDNLKKNNINFMCMMAGKNISIENKTLNKLINKYKLNNNCILCDEIQHTNEYLNSLNIHILPSSYGEGVSNSVLEALACGIPSIISTVGDYESLSISNDFIFKKNDYLELSKKISNYKKNIKNHNYLVDIKKRSINLAENNFNYDYFIKNYVNLWKK